MIEITSFLLKHLYELMADDYSARHNSDGAIRLLSESNSGSNIALCESQLNLTSESSKRSLKKEAATNQRTRIRTKIVRKSINDEEERSAPKRAPSSSPCRFEDFIDQSDDQNSDDSASVASLSINYQQSATISYLQTKNNENNLNTIDRIENLAISRGPTAKTATTSQTQPRASSVIITREQETNQQIVSFLTNNHLPDLFCETFIELLFIFVFLAISWIFVMIVQLHCHQLQQPARLFYCNTKFLASLMYCNSKHHLAAS